MEPAASRRPVSSLRRGIGLPPRPPLRLGRLPLLRHRSLGPLADGAARRATLHGAGRAIPVAEAAHRLDADVLAELAPQVADVELHLIARHGIRIGPDPLEQLVAVEDAAGAADEGAEEPELERREGDAP